MVKNTRTDSLNAQRQILEEVFKDLQNAGETMECKIKETAEKLTERLNGDKVEKIKPVANTIAEMIVRCNWESKRFKFKQESENIAFVVDGKDAFTAYLSGYNYAYQVKLCLDVIAAAGLSNGNITMQQTKPLNIFERAMKAIYDSKPPATFKPTPYERNVMGRSVGLLKSCGLEYICFSCVLRCDNTHALHIALQPAPNADKRLKKAIKAMDGAFRLARAKAGTTSCSVDGYTFEFPSVVLEFFKPRHMGKTNGGNNAK